MNFKNTISITAALAISVSGLFLPQIVSRIQESRQMNETIQYEIDSIQFDAPIPILQKLQMISQVQSYVSLENGKTLDKNTAYEAALHGVEELITSNRLLLNNWNEYTRHTETPFLAVTDDSQSPFIVWECILTAEDQSYLVLTIDEASQKIISFTIQAGVRENENSVTYERYFDVNKETVYAWNYALADYYGLATDEPQYSFYDPLISSNIFLTDEEGPFAQFPLIIQTNYVTFNSVTSNTSITSGADMSF